jgi:hypothetical protein
MKLSAAIEQALVSGTYNQCNEFMCCVLNDMDLDNHIPAVQAMVATIAPKPYPGMPLCNALHEAKIIDVNRDCYTATFAYTKQLYCWWVFDLKRKGM